MGKSISNLGDRTWVSVLCLPMGKNIAIVLLASANFLVSLPPLEHCWSRLEVMDENGVGMV